jgi:hypothetical protein
LISRTSESHHLPALLEDEKEEEMTLRANVTDNGLCSGEPEAVHDDLHCHISLTLILDRLSALEFPEKEHFENYLRYKWRPHRSPKTINSPFTSFVFFLDFYGRWDKSELKEIVRADLEAFIEHEQDQEVE